MGTSSINRHTRCVLIEGRVSIPAQRFSLLKWPERSLWFLWSVRGDAEVGEAGTMWMGTPRSVILNGGPSTVL